MTRLRLLLVVVALLALTSSCTLLWIFNNDPAGLPCDFTTSQTGACLDGYVCVNQGDNGFVCVVQGALDVGEACIASDQCDENLTCATLYGGLCAGEGADDPICSLIPDVEKELGCRQICEINNPQTCPNDTLCVDSEPDFCQRGVCSTDTDCELIAGSGALCSGEVLNEGKSGLCFEACDPLTCDGGVCPDCAGVDGIVNTNQACVPVFDEAVSTRNVCGLIGPIEFFDDCTSGGGCLPGSFCGDLGGGAVVCVPWCRVSGGNPACPPPSVCTEISVVADLGICL